MTRRALLPSALAAVIAALAGCQPALPAVPAYREVEIVNGTRELGEDAVVYVAGVIGACTGTLITPRVVLTAKHCVQSRGSAEPAPPPT